MLYDIDPCPKPRMTRQDKWRGQKGRKPIRPRVARYRAFADECRLKIKQGLEGATIWFVLPMPKSWSDRKRAEHNGKPHRQKPDMSNLLKALEDALYDDDSTIANYGGLHKVWGVTGSIQIIDRERE
jgi:Holliday junction resolvase RusA-like endonuclease